MLFILFNILHLIKILKQKKYGVNELPDAENKIKLTIINKFTQKKENKILPKLKDKILPVSYTDYINLLNRELYKNNPDIYFLFKKLKQFFLDNFQKDQVLKDIDVSSPSKVHLSFNKILQKVQNLKLQNLLKHALDSTIMDKFRKILEKKDAEPLNAQRLENTINKIKNLLSPQIPQNNVMKVILGIFLKKFTNLSLPEQNFRRKQLKTYFTDKGYDKTIIDKINNTLVRINDSPPPDLSPNINHKLKNKKQQLPKPNPQIHQMGLD